MAFFLGDTRGRFAALCHVRIAAGAAAAIEVDAAVHVVFSRFA
jgi:hypothetical protein